MVFEVNSAWSNLPSVLVRYINGEIHTQEFEGVFRGLAWYGDDNGLVVVGDAGRILKVTDGKTRVIRSKSLQNLRAVAANREDRTILTVGNSGTAILLDETDTQTRLDLSTTQNLRTVAWKPNGQEALIAGNGGTLLRYSKPTIETVTGARANLRRISWHPSRPQALVTSNCFAEEFVPSPNLFVFNDLDQSLKPVNEGRVDIIGADWKPDGKSALVVGYDVIWHNGFIGTFIEERVSPIAFENRHIYPVAASWCGSGEVAVVATATTQPGSGRGILYLFETDHVKAIFESDKLFFSSAKWNHDGTEFAALASSASRTFNC